MNDMRMHETKTRKYCISLGIAAFCCALTLSLATCAMPVANPGASGSGGTGHIVLSVPAIAAWAQPGFTSGSKSASSKAIGMVTSVTINIQNASGTDVITPVTTSVSLSSITTSVDIAAVPAGSDYTIKASVYNSHTSTTDPVVTGSVAGISVTAGATTKATVTCLPVSPASLSLDAKASASLATYSEKWYTMSVTSGTSYYVSESSGLCMVALFDANGGLLSSGTSSLSYASTYTGTLYICEIAEVAVEAGLTVSTTPAVINEGSVSAPVALTLGSAHSFLVGPYGGGSETSYYSFTTSSASAYVLDIPGATYFDASLYSDAAFTTLVTSSSSCVRGVPLSGLSASATYYLKLQTGNSSRIASSGQIVDAATYAAKIKNSDGSLAAPQTISVGASYAGKVGADYNDAVSYYTFTTGASGRDYSLSMGSISPSGNYLSIRVRDASGTSVYSTSQTNILSSANGLSTTLFLAPNTVYSVSVQNALGSDATSYNLKVATASEPTYVALADSTWAEGSLASSDSSVWYKATVSAGSYAFYLDSVTSGSGSYTGSVTVSAYNSDRSTAYFTNQSALYSGKAITVPSGETAVYFLVTMYDQPGSYALKFGLAPDSGSLTITAN